MRLYLRKLVVLLCGGFAVTLVLINLPSSTLKISEETDNSQPKAPKLPLSNVIKGSKKRLFQQTPNRQIQKQVPPSDNRGPLPARQIDIGSNSNSAGNSDLSREYVRFTRRIDENLLKMGRYLDEFYSSDAAKQPECTYNVTLDDYWLQKKGTRLPQGDNWFRFYAQISSCQLYSDDTVIDQLLHDLNTMPIEHVENMEGGTQIKLVITFQNGKKGVFKPMRFGRDYESDQNHFYFSDFERHVAEIATFHLDKVLGFRRAVPTVGRIMNIQTDLRDKADKSLAKTFFVSPAKNLCFVGKCDYYCDTTHAICGKPDLKEGSLQAFLPDDEQVPRTHNRSPYRRTYSKRNQKALWQKDDQFCEWKVKRKRKFVHGRRLLDIVDLYILDFLIGNQDRHHYESFSVFEDYISYPLHLDNGRAFGRTDFDDIDILKPLTQCCVIRPSTLRTLLTYYGGPVSLTEALHKSMSVDPVSPILAQKHYPALERRLEIVLSAVKHCIDSTDDWRSIIRISYDNPDVSEGQTSKEIDKEHQKDKERETKGNAHKKEVND